MDEMVGVCAPFLRFCCDQLTWSQAQLSSMRWAPWYVTRVHKPYTLNDCNLVSYGIASKLRESRPFLAYSQCPLNLLGQVP